MSDRAKAGRSMAWSAIESASLALISFGTLILYSRMLSVSTFGLFSVALAVIELLDVLVRMLFHDALVQRPEVTERHFDTAFTATMGLSLVLTGACWLAAPLFAELVKDPQAASVLRWMSLALPCAALTATVVARQRREFAFKSLAIRSFIGRMVGAGAGLVLVFMGAGIWALVAQQVLIALVGSLVLWFSGAKLPRLRFAWVECKELLGFGLYSVSSLILTFAIKRLFTILAGIGLGTHAAGVLNLAFRAVDAFNAIAGTAVAQVALPLLSSLQNDRTRLVRVYQTASAFTCLVMYSCFMGLGALAPEVVELMFGQRWLEASPYVTILSCLIIVQAPRILIVPLLTSVGRPAASMTARAAELVVMLAALLVSGVPTLDWAVGIWVARELVGFPIMGWILKSETGLGARQQLRGVWPPLVASVLMALGIWGIRTLLPADLSALSRACILIPCGAVIFLITIWLVDRKLVRDVIGFAGSIVQKRRAS
jgi:O-antigen/teichoic acid export membrane protein